MSDDSIWRPPASGESPPPDAPPPPPPPPGAPTGPPVGPPPSGSDPLEPSSPPPRRRRAPLVAAVVGVLAIGAAAIFAVTQLVGGDEGGAASPEELGQQVLEAIDDTDLLGLVDLLVPSERDVVRDPLTEIVDELRRLDLVSPPAGADGLEGVEFQVERTSVRVQPTNVDDITNLRLRGDLTVTVDGDALPIGDLLSELLDDPDRSEFDLRETEPFDVSFTSIELDGRWYLSMFYSLAEAARAEAEPVPDIPEVGIAPDGGATPDATVDAVLDALESLDLTRLVATLNPGEAGVFHRYGPLFVDDAQAELDLVPLRWEIVDSEYTISGSGSTRSVDLRRLAIEGRADGADFEFEFDEGCLRGAADGDRFDSCEDGFDEFSLDDIVGTSPAAREMIELLEEMFADYEQPGLTLRQTDGRWYVSPLGTLFDQVLAGLRAIDREELERFVELLPEVLDEALFGPAGEFDDPFGDPFDQDDFFDDFFDDEFDDPFDDPFDDDGFDDGFDDAFEPSAVDECYGLADVDEAISCFDSVLAAGEAEEWQVAAEMRFPECGAAEAHWNGYFALDDDEFIALVTESRPCFLALVDAGELDPFDVPLAMSDVECFEGRNWFAVFDDPEYDDRFFDCVGF
jgi:hypothetical protein